MNHMKITTSITTVWTTVILLTIINIISARPSCKFKEENQGDLECSPGETDYGLRRGLVSDNNRTTGITLRGCRITSIGLESFQNLFYLKHLDLSKNKIQRLKLGVFDGHRRVLTLNLSSNLLTSFPLGLFDQKPNLEVLDLKDNKINNLELGIFDNLKRLMHLDLSSNRLLGKDINPYLFDKSPKIRFMDFSRCNMEDSPDNLLHAFREIDFLNLDKCSLTAVPTFVTVSNLRTMKHLMLSVNLISKLNDPNMFVNLENLEILNFVSNSIENIDENIFRNLRKLKMILLRSNKIKILPDSLFQNLRALINIDLSHNLIEFVPVNAFRGTALKNLNLADNRFTYLTDSFVLELRNSGASLTKIFFNQNPWQCACLRRFLNEIKLLKVDYNSMKYNGKEPVCVTTNDFTCKHHMNQFYLELYYNLIKSH